MSNNFFLAFSVCILGFTLDTVATIYGTRFDQSKESNKVVLLLWKMFGKFRWLLGLIYPISIFSIAYIASIVNAKFSLWFLYTIAIAHLIGFLSWTPLNIFRSKLHKIDYKLLLIGLITISGGLSYLLLALIG